MFISIITQFSSYILDSLESLKLIISLKGSSQKQKDDICASALKPVVKVRNMQPYKLEIFHANNSLRRTFINEI